MHILHTLSSEGTIQYSLHKNRPAISKKGSRVAYSQCMHDGKHNPYVFVVWWPEWANSFLAPGVNEWTTVALVVVVALCMSIIVIASILTSYTYIWNGQIFFCLDAYGLSKVLEWWIIGGYLVSSMYACSHFVIQQNFEPLKGRILTNWGNVPL